MNNQNKPFNLTRPNEPIDILSNPFFENALKRPDQIWTTLFTFVSPSLVPCPGLLTLSGRAWSIRDNNCGADAHTTPLADRAAEMLFRHESVVRERYATDFYFQMRRVASAVPFIYITVEPLYESQQESFASISRDEGLRMLVQWTNDGQSRKRDHDSAIGADLLPSKRCFVDVDRDGELYGDSQDSFVLMDKVGEGGGEEEEDRDNSRDADDDGECSVDNSLRRAQPEAVPERQQRQVVEQQRISIGTRVSIQLNDSSVKEIFSFDLNERSTQEENSAALKKREKTQRLYFDAMLALESFFHKFRLRCSPTDVSLSPPIPLLDSRHGLLLSLYGYQRRAVHWLLALEQRESLGLCNGVLVSAHAGVQYRHLPLRVDDGQIVLDQKSIRHKTYRLDVAGGILAAKTGTGKTTIMIALIHMQRCFEANILRKGRVASDVGLSDDRLAPRWSRFDSKLFYANCTLVVCPRQMVQQWADEFSKTLQSGGARPLRIDSVRTVADVRRISIADVQQRLDVLIVNKQIFASPAYRKLRIDTNIDAVKSSNSVMRKVRNHTKYTYWYDDDDILTRLVSISNRLTRTTKGAMSTGCVFESLVLHAIHWRRVVIDEVHELDRSWAMVERACASLTSDHTEGLTATPDFDSRDGFGHARDTSNSASNTVQKGYPALLNVRQGKALLGSSNNAFRHFFTHMHAITSSGTVGMPRVYMHRVDVSLSPTEFAVYSSITLSDLKRRLLFCSHHVLDDEQWQRLLNGGEDDDDDDMGNGAQSGLRALGKKVLSVEDVAEAMQSKRRRKIARLDSTLASLMDERTTMQRAPMIAYTDSDIYKRLAEIYDADEPTPASANMMMIQLSRFVSLGTIYVCRVTDRDRENVATLPEKEERHRKQVALRNDVEHGRVCMTADVKIILRREFAMIEGTVVELSRTINATERKLTDCRREFNFFDAVFNRLSNPDEQMTCPVCMDEEATKESIVLTACGHDMCVGCSRQWFERSRICPTCRAQVNIHRDLRTIDRRAIAATPPPPPLPLPLRSDDGKSASTTDAVAKADNSANRHGSKIGALIRLIAALRARGDFRKLVIYAQFERLLKLVFNALKECGEEVLMVRGSALQCQKAISTFNNDARFKIILLSSENTISGVHLTAANHLIALHPILGSPEEAFAKHWQAIGRIRRLVQSRDCHVWSLVTRGTCEETMYRAQIQYAQQKLRRDLLIVWNGDNGRAILRNN